jgi:hypothetical protein
VRSLKACGNFVNLGWVVLAAVITPAERSARTATGQQPPRVHALVDEQGGDVDGRAGPSARGSLSPTRNFHRIVRIAGGSSRRKADPKRREQEADLVVERVFRNARELPDRSGSRVKVSVMTSRWER